MKQSKELLLKILYWITTTVLCGIMLFSAQMYFRNTEMIRGFFQNFSYPTYLVIPLAIAKILGVLIILYNKISWLKEWAYAGFFFDLLLATTAHYYAGHDLGLSFYGLLLLIISYSLSKKVRS